MVVFVIPLLAAILPKLKLSGIFQTSSFEKNLNQLQKILRESKTLLVKEYSFSLFYPVSCGWDLYLCWWVIFSGKKKKDRTASGMNRSIRGTEKLWSGFCTAKAGKGHNKLFLGHMTQNPEDASWMSSLTKFFLMSHPSRPQPPFIDPLTFLIP